MQRDLPILDPQPRRLSYLRLCTMALVHPMHKTQRLELGELLDGLAGAGKDAEHVEAHSLGEGSALADDDLVTGLDTEGGGDVSGEVLVALLVTGVLGDEVEVFAADDQGACTDC
jgi:hypothetical protein